MRQLNIRIDSDLYKQLSEEAWQRRVSLNKYAVRLLKFHPAREKKSENGGRANLPPSGS